MMMRTTKVTPPIIRMFKLFFVSGKIMILINYS